MSEVVRMHIGRAHDLAADYVASAVRVDDIADELAELMRTVGRVATTPVPYWSVVQLADLAFDLRHDEADLAWRIDFLETSDRSFMQEGHAIGILPSHRPTADATVADAVALALSLTDGPDVEATERFLPDYIELIDALDSARYEPAWLARFFDELGAKATLELSEALGVAGITEVIHFGTPLADPNELHRTLADSLAIAATENDARGDAVLDFIWFIELSARGIDGDRVQQSWVRLFDTHEPIRRDQQLHLAILGLEVMDGQRTIDGPGSVSVDDGSWDVGPDTLTAAEASSILLRPVIANPDQATRTLLIETADGRAGVEIVADRSIDSGDLPNPLAALAVAGTLDAQAIAIQDGVVVDPELASGALEATGQLLAEIAAQERGAAAGAGGYDAARVLAFTEIVTYSLPQFLRSEYNADELDHHRLLPGATVPSFDGGVRVSPNELSLVFGVLFRDPEARAALGTAGELARRDLLTEDGSSQAHINAGELGGVIVNGLTRAGIQEAHWQAAAIAEFHDEADKIWGAFDFAVRRVGRKLPVIGAPLGAGLALYDQATGWASGAGFDVEGRLQDAIQGDGPQFDNPITVQEATMAGADHRQDGQFNNNRLLLAVEFEKMRAGFAEGDPSDTAIALDEAIRTNPILAEHYTPGVTTHADLATGGPLLRQELSEIAARLTHDEFGLKESRNDLYEGFHNVADSTITGS